jgi:hypothetical protein
MSLTADDKKMENPILDYPAEVVRLKNGGYRFNLKAILTSAAAATAVVILSRENVERLKALGVVAIEGLKFFVDGATAWATTATVVVKTIEDTPAAIATVAVAELTGNTVVQDVADMTLTKLFVNGLPAGAGMQVVGNANGTGSDLIVNVWGTIK